MSDQIIYKKDIFGIERNIFNNSGTAHLYCYGKEVIRLHMHSIIWVLNEEEDFSIKVHGNEVANKCTITGSLDDIKAFAKSIQVDCAIFD